MGQMYIISAKVSAVTTAKDLLEIGAHSTRAVRVHRLALANASVDSTADALELEWGRATTSGSGGSAVTPRALAGGPTAVTTAEAGNSTPAGTKTAVEVDACNVLAGWQRVFTPDERPEIAPGGFLYLASKNTINSADLTVSATVEEIGG